MKKIFILLAVALGLTTAQAQEIDHEKGYNFIGLKGGAQATLTHYKFTDLITPQYGIYLGRYFNQFVGARLDITGYEGKGGFKADRYSYVNNDVAYEYKACTADLDLLMNMSNIINPNRTNRTWNWNLLAGFGVNYSWDYDEFKTLTNSFKYYDGPMQCGTKHATFNGRLGTQVEYNVSDNFSIMLEADANYKNDQYNLKFNDKCDWQIQAFVGLTYKFGYKKKPAPVVEEEVVLPPPPPAPTYRCNACDDKCANGQCTEAEYGRCINDSKCNHSSNCKCKMERPVVKKEEPLKETIFYQIRESDANKETVLNKVVAWCNEYPNKSITISGYADKGTGTPALNVGYAKQRAEKVAKALQEKGIDASRMTVNSYGDTVQPFEDNDSNRCVIIVGE